MKITICLIIKDENEYLQEWMDYHRKVGVSHFYIYDNNSKVPLSEFLKNEKDVTVIEWPYTQIGSQNFAYEHCFKTYKNEVDKIAFIDTDEFISFDPKFNTIQEVWEYLEEKYGKINSMGLYWRMYGKSKPYFETRQPIENYTEYHENSHIKSILDPKIINYFTDPHHAINNGKYINEKNEGIVGPFGSNQQFGNDSHTSEIIWIKHTWTRSKSEFEIKINRGSGDHVQRTITIEQFYDYNNKCK
jgi:Glycosyltransferase family 92